MMKQKRVCKNDKHSALLAHAGREELLDDLNLSYKELRSLGEALYKKVHHSDAKAIEGAGAYVIFEAIMYTHVISPAAGKAWMPVCLTAWVSIAFWLAFITTMNESLRLRRQQDLIFIEQERLHRKIFSIRTGRKLIDGGAATQQSLAKQFAFLRLQRYAYVGVMHLALLSFTLLVLYGLLPQTRIPSMWLGLA